MGGLLFEEENPCSAQSSGMFRRDYSPLCVHVCVRARPDVCVSECMPKTKKATNVPPAKTKLIPKCVYVCVRASIPKASSQNVLPNNLVPKCVCV